ncbi:MAG: DMT family transporter, partial [Bacteroidales bacterium]|nr:DMT family transporter [Bacteroidales bacterium]
FLYYLILFKAYSLLPAQVAQALNMIWPLLLVLLSIPILGQKIGWMSILAMIISFLGALFIALQGDLGTLFQGRLQIQNPWGVVLALGSAFLWAFYFLLNMKSKVSGARGLLMNFLFAWIYIALFLLIRFLLATTTSYVGNYSLRSVLSAIYIGMFEMAVPFVIWLKALTLAKNTAAVSSLIYIFPFLSLVLIHYVLGEPIFSSTIIGLVLIISGVLLSRFSNSGKSRTFV